jgi:hypothetical protein
MADTTPELTLLDREPIDSVAETLRARPAAIVWRARRIAGRLLADARTRGKPTRRSAAVQT